MRLSRSARVFWRGCAGAIGADRVPSYTLPLARSVDHTYERCSDYRRTCPLKDTPGEAYLRDVRRIDVSVISNVLGRTDAIGWHPSVYFNEPGHELHTQHLGAIVGVMTDAVTACPTRAISRTYIHNGRKIGKAKTLGAPAGIVRLTPDEDVLEGLHLAAAAVAPRRTALNIELNRIGRDIFRRRLAECIDEGIRLSIRTVYHAPGPHRAAPRRGRRHGLERTKL